MTTTNEDAGPSELHEAARQFHNLTQGDSTVIIRAPSAEKRDAIIAAGERLRAALSSKVQVEAVRATDDDDVESDGRLPALASTLEGKRLYSMAYARGRARERLNASGRLRASSRPAAAEEPTHQEMRLMLPEGGYVNLFWPDELTAESAHMLSEMFSTVMQAFARAAKSKSPDDAAASGGEKEVRHDV